MSTKVSKVGGLVKVEAPEETIYINGKCLELLIRPEAVCIASEFLEKSITISYNDFQDGTGAPINTAETIAEYINGLIE